MAIHGIIQVTSSYSNAVLCAVLPHFSDFAAKIEAPVILPITTNHVGMFGPSTRDIGGTVLLTNGMYFRFGNGHVEFYKSPLYDKEQAIWIGKTDPVKHSKKEAIEIVRKKIQTLGFDLEVLNMDADPVVTEVPEVIRDRKLGQYHMEWYRPNTESTVGVEAVVNASSGALELLTLMNPWISTVPLDLAVQPTIIPGSSKIKPLDETERTSLLAELLPAANTFAEKLKLPLQFPIEAKQIQKFDSVKRGRYIDSRLTLSNGWTFQAYGKKVCGYARPEVFFGFQPVKIKDFAGPWNLSQSKALELAREAASRIEGLAPSFLKRRPNIVTPCNKLKPVIPRYGFTWGPPDSSPGSPSVTVEVDADKGRVTALVILTPDLFVGESK